MRKYFNHDWFLITLLAVYTLTRNDQMHIYLLKWRRNWSYVTDFVYRHSICRPKNWDDVLGAVLWRGIYWHLTHSASITALLNMVFLCRMIIAFENHNKTGVLADRFILCEIRNLFVWLLIVTVFFMTTTFSQDKVIIV